MTKKKSTRKKDETTRTLKYNGRVEQGQNAGSYITNPVLVPARDLNFYDLVDLAAQWSESSGERKETDDVVALLTDGAPGRRTWDARPLYQVDEPWKCEVCSKKFTDWNEFHKHSLEDHQEGGDDGSRTESI